MFYICRRYQKKQTLDTEKKIMTAIEQLFLRYGVKSVTMDDISRQLGMSKKTLYQYVDNKADLIKKVMQQHIETEQEAMSQIRQQAKDAIDEMLGIARYVTQMLREMSPSTVYDLHKHYRETWDMVESFHQQHIYNFIKTNLENGVKEGLYRSDFDADIIAKLYVAKTMLIVNEDVFPLRNYNKEKLFKALLVYHIHGVASAKGLKKLERYLLNESQESPQ
jgi:TetR/AcrR family transcriptional regulator, cholesterol catabolism regulator